MSRNYSFNGLEILCDLTNAAALFVKLKRVKGSPVYVVVWDNTFNIKPQLLHPALIWQQF